MKKFFTTQAILFGISMLNVCAQQVHPHYWDGQLYFRTATFSPMGGNSNKVDLKEAYFLSEEELAQFGITEIKKPFWRAKDPSIQAIYRLTFTEKEQVYELIKTMEAKPEIDYAEQVPIHRTTLTPNDLGTNSSSGTGQWHLWKIQAQQAWDLATGNPNIKVAIVDDAVKINHPDLAPALWVNPGEIAGNGIDDDGNGYVDDVNGYDVADDDSNPMPTANDMSHGTHVAGISGAATNNGVGIASIGYNLKIIAVKSTNSVSAITDGYSGVIYAADAGAKVINMSWGGSGGGQTGQNIMNYAHNKGCVLVAAAGNDNSTSIFYPAGFTNVISVASTTTNDAKSSFSNYGSWIDISSPGSSIRSTYIISSTGADTYAFNQGTSMASPLVAGLCGLMYSLNPNLTKPQLESCLYNNTDPVTSNTNQMGAGRINAFKAMQCVNNTVSAAPVSSVSANLTNACAGTAIQFNGSSLGGPATGYQWTFPGGNPATSNVQNPTVTYSANGNYSVTLTTSNSFGSSTETFPNFISISNTAVQEMYRQDFETSPTGFTVTNPDNGTTWVVATTAGNLSGSKSAAINYFSYTSLNQRDGLISPVLDFSQNINIEMEFTHAYRRKNQQSSDSLIIKVSTDGGNTYTRIWQRGENGQGTFATQSTSTTNFVPAAATDWCFDGTVGTSCFIIPLAQFDGEPNVRIMFESFNRNGNNLYLDDIVIRGICSATPPPPPAPVPNFSANNNIICAGETIAMNNTSVNADSYQWTFPGGTPPTATSVNPSVTYNTPGSYSITLSATGPGGTETLTYQSFVVVNPTPTAGISQSGNVLTASPSGLFYQWYLNGTAIGGATAQQYTATQPGNYSVEVFNEDNCSDMSNAITIIDNSSVENPEWYDVKVFPNPTDGMLTIQWGGNQALSTVRIINSLGQTVGVSAPVNTGLTQLDLSHLATGVYYVEMVFEDQKRLVEKITLNR
jgi:subtilisin family serine protease